MKQAFLILILLAAVAMPSCIEVYVADGPIETRTYDLADFKGVELDGSGDVFIFKGDEFKVEVTTNSDLFDYLNLYVSDHTIHLGPRKGYFNLKYSKLQYKITLPELNYVALDGSGDITALDNFVAPNDFLLSIDGSGDILMNELSAQRIFFEINGSGDITTSNIDCELADFEIDGSGNINSRGYAVKQVIDINGSGDVKTSSLETEECFIDINGSGNSRVLVFDYLKVRINGSGSVYYTGNPDTEISRNGSGKVYKY
jgi:hypothetical protein